MIKYKLPLLVILILCLNALIYVRAVMTIEDADLIFAECARNSGRTSAAINLTTLILLGYFGLKSIYSESRKLRNFRLLITLFAINHLVHFFFVSQNFKSQLLDLDISHNIHGFITFVLILALPIVLFVVKKLSLLLHIAVIIHLLNVTYFISETFYGRYNSEDPAYLHRIGILVMIVACLGMLYRTFKERKVLVN